MNRLVSLVMLACLIAQQFVCCCGGEAIASTGHEHHLVMPSAVAKSTLRCEHRHAGHSHRHSHSGDEHPCPDGDSHEHHLCLASHLLFAGAARAELPHLDMGTNGWAATSDHQSHCIRLAINSAMSDIDRGPPLTTLPVRAVLGVYRI